MELWKLKKILEEVEKDYGKDCEVKIDLGSLWPIVNIDSVELIKRKKVLYLQGTVS